MGLIVAGGILLGVAGESHAQYGTPMGFSYGYPNYSGYSNYTTYTGVGFPGYRAGYNNIAGNYGTAYGYNNYSTAGYVAGPGTFSYSSGYRGYVAPVNPYGYSNRPYYGAYGYGNYSYGSRDGFRPFRGMGRGFRY